MSTSWKTGRTAIYIRKYGSHMGLQRVRGSHHLKLGAEGHQNYTGNDFPHRLLLKSLPTKQTMPSLLFELHWTVVS